MPVDVYIGFYYLLRMDMAQTISEEALKSAQLRELTEMARLYSQSFGEPGRG